MNRRFAFGLASAAIIFVITLAGCDKKEEPVSRAPAPPAEVPAGTGDVASAPAGKTSPGMSAAGEAKTTRKEESGEFF